ncbi:MAG: hypothetical protein BWX89_00756 [candidate division TA06 bacterium ADurb.Bin131]|jgi:hypothetical protein|uniref:Uncharacterized protein n=1 Tax=candidate division TA06 bacterium ADurb.Bin131 TaxID=1852827 RepID=A0A1V6CAQ0_UNCT6|nr:MAG: hypothetical protein BWX89_00756 [candidate division TA06 bacterium ADurb.Bin131]
MAVQVKFYKINVLRTYSKSFISFFLRKDDLLVPFIKEGVNGFLTPIFSKDGPGEIVILNSKTLSFYIV